MKLLTRGIIGGLVVGAALLLSGCFRGDPPPPYRMGLEIWGVFDDSDVYAKVFNEYNEINEHIINIKYRKFDEQNYKQDVIDALAAGNGPDIIMIRNNWLEDFREKIVPAPPTLVDEKTFKESFVDVVPYDFFSETDKKVYAVPLSVDSLALYYNKDIFNIAGITAPPQTWEEVAGLVPKLTRIDQYGNITQSAIALGTSANINRASDILALLMMQLGSPMRKDTGEIDLANTAGVRALEFYTGFARGGSPAYTWNARQHYSIDAFYEGTLGMTVNYAYAYPTFKQKNAKLNIGIAPLPQVSTTDPMNIANYWGFAVVENKTIEPKSEAEANVLPQASEDRKKMREHEAWQFLTYLTMPHPGKTFRFSNALSEDQEVLTIPSDPAEEYLKLTRKPAARKDLIERQKSDPILSAFASGNLVARDWRQAKPESVEQHFLSMIDDVIRGDKLPLDALKVAQERVRQLGFR